MAKPKIPPAAGPWTCPPWCIEDEDVHDRDGVCRTHRCELGEGRVTVRLLQYHWSDEPDPEPMEIQVDYRNPRQSGCRADIECLAPDDAGALADLLRRARHLADAT